MEKMKDLNDVGDALSRVQGKLAFLQTVLGASCEHGCSGLTLNGDEQAGVFWIFQDLTEDISRIDKTLDEISRSKNAPNLP